MRILITSGLHATDVGGPAQYGPNLKEAFLDEGYGVKLLLYAAVERVLPPGLRHLYFFLKIIPSCLQASYILTLDTWSVGLPTVLAGIMCGKKVIVRVGGDYLWSTYVNRTGEPITLTEFYRNMPELNLKEKLLLFFTKILARRAGFLAFNTEWQKNIWVLFYGLNENKVGVVRNFIPSKVESNIPRVKDFLWAGRNIPEKNIGTLKRVVERLVEKHPEFELCILTNRSQEEVLNHIKNCYAVVSPAISDICPNFILEGISFGKPFVMTNETGLNELYPEGGIFFDPLNEEEIERALEAMLDFRVYNKSVEALRNINRERSWQVVAQEYIDIWKQN